ncbi:TadE/TadG family type IV pilus assembly protein [Bauldia litoralis]|uniref:TadE/TadG family type IV pilus assembly protein n=1 Tax=Bauldia litoralis TaxID=665467 RepID=UPI003264E238
MAKVGSGDAPRARRGSFRRFRRDENGATAIEFGIIALPFIALMMAIIETAIVFFAGQAMETAVDRASRLVRTGQAQQQGFSAEDFKKEVCSGVMSLLDCDGGLKIDVATYKSFGDIALTKPVDGAGNLKKTFDYKPGNGGDIVVVRAFYEWPVYINLLGHNLANMANGTHLLSSATAFRNEPFPW